MIIFNCYGEAKKKPVLENDNVFFFLIKYMRFTYNTRLKGWTIYCYNIIIIIVADLYYHYYCTAI